MRSYQGGACTYFEMYFFSCQFPKKWKQIPGTFNLRGFLSIAVCFGKIARSFGSELCVFLTL
jgi:hypothetical protein